MNNIYTRGGGYEGGEGEGGKSIILYIERI